MWFVSSREVECEENIRQTKILLRVIIKTEQQGWERQLHKGEIRKLILYTLILIFFLEKNTFPLISIINS